jgi:hypothetical protein
VEAITSLLSAFGISAPAGLNAYLPLLIVGVVSRFTGLITLAEPFDILANEWVLGALGLLSAVEIAVDKIPGADHVNDAISTFIRPAAGAVLFASTSNVISDVHPALAAVCGLLVAGGVHAAKTTFRPVVTTMSAGIGNPVVSTIENVLTVVATIAAILAPILVAVGFVAFLVVAVLVGRKLLSSRRSATRAPA